MTAAAETQRNCTKCGHTEAHHRMLAPQCSHPRCSCLRYAPGVATTAPAPIPGLSTPAVRRPTPPPALAVVPPVKADAQVAQVAEAPAVDELIRACARSDSKRTQALGVKLADLAEKARAALRTEREAAEAKAARSKEVAAAQAEVKRLEKLLADAKAKAVAAGASGGARGGPCICPECEQGFSSAQALGAHRSRKHGYRRANDG